MELQSLTIRNWREIENIDIRFENLMLFLGQSSDGVNNIISALTFAFKRKDLEKDDIFDGADFTTIKLNFEDEGKEYKLKITASYKERTSYYIKEDRTWIEIEEWEYKKIISKIHFIHLVGDLKKQYKDIFSIFLEKIIKDREDKRVIVERLSTVYKKLNEGYKDVELYRNMFFEFLKIITELSLKKEKTLLPNTIILFEDPELYLHPQKSRELYNYFIKLSKLGTKIYLKTYSSSFLGLKQYKSICVVTKAKGKVGVVQANKSFGKDEIKAFNMNYWINPDRSELFFAKKVILVEGQTDKIVIAFLAKLLGIFKYDYSIIECGSKSTIPQFITLLNLFKIPYIVVYDKDNHKWRTKEEIFNSNQKNKMIKSMIRNHLGTYVEFENDIEEEIYAKSNERACYKNKPFNALKHVSEEDYKVPQRLENKIRKIYK